jgi:hypothetical protein
MDKLTRQLGFWSAIIITLLVIAIDLGMILSVLLLPPINTTTSIEDYTATFTSAQMIPFIPSLLLAPAFVIFMLCIHRSAPDDKKFLSQLALYFAIICAAILAIHYYVQLSVVQQAILNNETDGVWLFASPNPHSFFWTFAALGYGFMGIALLFAAPVFNEKTDRATKGLFIANGLIGIIFLTGNAAGIITINILASFIWGTIFPITTILVARKFRKPQEP